MVHVHMYQSITIHGKGCNALSMENASITPLVFLNMLRISSCTHDGGDQTTRKCPKDSGVTVISALKDTI